MEGGRWKVEGGRWKLEGGRWKVDGGIEAKKMDKFLGFIRIECRVVWDECTQISWIRL